MNHGMNRSMIARARHKLIQIPRVVMEEMRMENQTSGVRLCDIHVCGIRDCGIRVYCEQSGETGKPLLLLHGWGGSTESWVPVVRDFKDHRRVYAIDFPGHGKTPEPPEPYSVTEFMQMTAELIRELGIEGCDIMAHSFGGRVALLLAATHPELVGKLVLTGSAGLPPRRSAGYKLKQAVYACVKCVLGAPAKLLLGEARAQKVRERLQVRFGSRDYRNATPGMRKTFVRVVQQDIGPHLPSVRAATLLLWGDADTETPLWMAKAMEQQIPNCGLVVFAGAGHFAYLERYGEFYRISRNFLSGE